MHLNEKIDPKETTRRDAAKDLIELVREAWELDSTFCTNYVLTLNERKDGSLVIRLHTPNVSHGGEEIVYLFAFADEDEAAKTQLENGGLFEKYEALLSEDEESDEAAQMWSDAKNSYYNDGDEGWLADEVEEALASIKS